METTMKKAIYEHLALVWSGTAGQEAAEDCVVPDTMPDISSVLDTDGYVTLRSKEAEAGSVQLSVSVSAWVLYAPEGEGRPRSLELTLPAEISMDAPGVDGECRPVAKIRIRNLEARAVNSRKVTLRAELEAEAWCYRRETMELPAGLAAEEKGVHILEQSTEAVLVSDVREKTFVATDEFSLPAGWEDVGAILSRRTEILLDEVKYTGGKVLFRGRILSELLLAGEGNDLYLGRYETEFSQIMEMDGGDGDAAPQMALMLTGVFYDLPGFSREQSRITAEIHVAAQCVCRPRREILYLRDIYSTRLELVPSWESVILPMDHRPVTVRQTVAGRVEPVPSGGELFSARASAGGISVEGRTVKTSIQVRLLFRDGEGAYTSVRNRMPAEFTVSDLPDKVELRDITVSILDVYCGTGAGGADVKIVLQMDGTAVREQTIPVVSGVMVNEEASCGRARTASVTMVRVSGEADTWELAKRYCSTVDAIREANEGRREGILLIPRGR